MSTETKKTGVVRVLGIGPGAADLMAPRALAALQTADTIIGYKAYLEQAKDSLNPAAELLSSSMMQEMDRCGRALELADGGHEVALVCGGHGAHGVEVEQGPEAPHGGEAPLLLAPGRDGDVRGVEGGGAVRPGGDVGAADPVGVGALERGVRVIGGEVRHMKVHGRLCRVRGQVRH